MMTISMMDGYKFNITDEEYQNLNKTTSPIIHFRSCNVAVNRSSISSIYPERTAERNNRVGRLHDGGRVKKHFGQWVLDTGQTPDDKGNYAHVTLDPAYYPEVALDCVATEEEFTKLNGQDYYEFLGIKERDKRLDSGFKQIMECPKNS